MRLRPVLLKFGAFTLDLRLCVLRTVQREIDMRPKTFDVLCHLVENSGRLVRRDHLIAAVWPNVTVTDESLTQCVSEIRRALGDHDHALIRTLARRGYLFTALVEKIWHAETMEGQPAAVTPPHGILQVAWQGKQPDQPSIAVLPFANMSGDAEQEYFADGLVEDLLSALSRIRWLFVIARQSSFSYRHRPVEVRQIARELRVRYVVEGSVRKSDNRVRVTAQLIDAEFETHIWADRYEGGLGDFFALQDDVAEQIASAIEPRIRALEIRRARAKPTKSLTAYDLYLCALPEYGALTEAGHKRAHKLLRKAVDRSPENPEALGTLVDCVMAGAMSGWYESVARGRAEVSEFARRALAAAPDNSECIASVAFAYANMPDRHEEAVDLVERAIQQRPNSLFVRNRAGTVYGNCGESDKAIAQYEMGMRMGPRDPRSYPLTLTGLAAAHFFARRFDECAIWARRAVAISPGANVARRFVAAAAAHQGHKKEARLAVAELLKHQPNASLARSRTSSFQHSWMLELYLDGLRRAGLPDNSD
jgi:adenylate cyclase